MGLPMARNLRTAGYRVVGFDVSAAAQDAARELGIDVADTPADAARRTATALVVVGFDDQAVTVVAAAERGLLAGAAAGFVVAMCSTVESTTSLTLAEQCQKSGVVLVDATLCL